jgi:hypothetical protein
MPVIAMLLPAPKIPEHLQVLIGKVHNSVSGHHGVERTLRMLTTPSSIDSTVILVNPQTPSLRIYVKQYIALCPCCQKNEHVEDSDPLTSIYIISLLPNGVSKHRLYRPLPQ